MPPTPLKAALTYINPPSTLYATLSSLKKDVPLLHTQWGETAVYNASPNGHNVLYSE